MTSDLWLMPVEWDVVVMVISHPFPPSHNRGPSAIAHFVIDTIVVDVRVSNVTFISLHSALLLTIGTYSLIGSSVLVLFYTFFKSQKSLSLISSSSVITIKALT